MREKTHIMKTSLQINPHNGHAERLNAEAPKNAVAARKSLVGVLASLAAVACLQLLPCTEAKASLMAYEGFNYSTGSGNLTGLNGGFGWSGAWDALEGMQDHAAVPVELMRDAVGRIG